MDVELTGSANCLPPGTQVGEYRLLGVVGEGGFGVVYRARDLSLDRIVAIKEYMPSTLAGRTSSNEIHVRAQHKGAFDAGLRSFINEARLLAKFSHPALVHVYRFFEENGTAYMVMRYYEGQTFRAFLAEQEGGMNEQWLCAMLSPILDVLEMLHAADCFHRDIAPDNVFLQSSGMPVLLDFGAARRIIGDMTQALTMVLKPGYAPIEQYADDGAMPQGAWTDIYQLGAMLYLAITGKVPTTSVARMISDPIRLLTPADFPGYSESFLHGVHRALAVKPADRPQSIAELKSLLGIRTFSSSAMSAWAVSSGMPLDSISPEPLSALTRSVNLSHTSSGRAEHPAPQPQEAAVVPAPPASQAHDPLAGLRAPPQAESAVAPVDTAPADQTVALMSETSRPVASEAVNSRSAASADKTIVTVPISMPVKYPVDARAGGALKDQEATSGATKGGAESASPAGPRKSWTSLWVVAGVCLLAVVWLWSRGDSGPEASQGAVVEQQTWESPKEEHAEVSETDKQVRELVPPPDIPVQIAKPEPTIPSPVDSASVKPATEGTRPAGEGAASAGLLAVAADAESKPLAAPVEKGTVTLHVKPWANVRIGGVAAGVTPPKKQWDLPEGQHEIEITNPAGIPKRWTVQVKKNEPVVLSHQFE